MNQTAGSYLTLRCGCGHDEMFITYGTKNQEYHVFCVDCGGHIATIPSYGFNYATDSPEPPAADEDDDMDNDLDIFGGYEAVTSKEEKHEMD